MVLHILTNFEINVVFNSQDQESVQFHAHGAPHTDGVQYSSDQILVTAHTAVPRNSIFTGNSNDQILEEVSVDYDSEADIDIADRELLNSLTSEKQDELNKPVPDFRPLQAELRNRLKLQTSHSHSHFSSLPCNSELDGDSWLPESTLDVKDYLATGGPGQRRTLNEALSIRGASRGQKFTAAAKSSFLAGMFQNHCFYNISCLE